MLILFIISIVEEHTLGAERPLQDMAAVYGVMVGSLYWRDGNTKMRQQHIL